MSFRNNEIKNKNKLFITQEDRRNKKEKVKMRSMFGEGGKSIHSGK